jgi:hypothetical protein
MGNLPTGNAASTATVSPSISTSPISSNYIPKSSTYLTNGQSDASVIPQDKSSSSSTSTPASDLTSSGLSDIQNQINITKDALESAKAQLASMQSTSSSTPSAISSAQAAVTTAENAYQEALKLSPDEITTQEDLDKLIESTKKAYLNTSGQVIPMEFITGQLKAIEERATGLAEPLETKLARLQAQRTSATDASKFALERADANLAAEQKSATPTEPTTQEINGKLYQYDYSTGTWKDTGVSSGKSTTSEAPKTIETAEGIYQWNQTTGQWDDTGMKSKDAEVESTGELNEIASSAVSNVNDLLASNLDFVTGLPSLSNLIPGSEGSGVKAKFNQLINTLALSARSLVKGSGAISDKETEMLKSSATLLKEGLSKEATISELKKIRGILNSNAGNMVSVRVLSNGQEIDAGQLSREDIYSAISQGYQIIYE